MTSAEHPQARVERVRAGRWGGLLPLMALFLALYLGAQAWYAQGPRLTLHVEEGHALGVGDPLKFRGVTVGIVESMEVASDLESVTVVVRVDSSAEGICRAGSRFWIVHPEVGLDRFKGLETLVGAHYITVDPGDPGGPYRFEFDALPREPALPSQDSGGLGIRLMAPERGGLAAGAQVTYRGETVGSVLGTRLISDGTAVQIDLHIQREYVGLVQSNSKFWRTGGFEINLALLGGLSMELDSLRSLVVGGVAFATPEQSAAPATKDTRFDLHENPEDEWREWRPSLSVLRDGLLPHLATQRPLRAVLQFETGRLISRSKKREGWAIPLPTGILGPQQLLEVPADADRETASLTVDGVEINLESKPTWRGTNLVLRPADLPNVQPLQLEQVRVGADPQDCTVYSGLRGRSLSVSHARLSSIEGKWQLDEGIDLEEFESGSLVWGMSSAKYVGILLVGDGEAFVVPFAADLW